MDHLSPLEKPYNFLSDPVFKNTTINTADFDNTPLYGNSSNSVLENKTTTDFDNNQLYEKKNNSKGCMESLFNFTKKYNTSILLNAIQKAGLQSTVSPISLNQTEVLNSDTSNTTSSQTPVLNVNSGNQIQNKTSDYNALVSIGSTVEMSSPVITINTTTNLGEIIHEILSGDFTTLKAGEVNRELLLFYIDLQHKLVNLLRPGMEILEINNLQVTQPVAPRSDPSLSGVHFVTNTNDPITSSRTQLRQLFDASGVGNQYSHYQTLLDTLKDVNHFVHLYRHGQISKQLLQNMVSGFSTTAEDNNVSLENIFISKRFINTTIKTEISGLNLQIYSKPVLGLNGSLGFDLQNHDLSIGIGKAKFLPFRDSNFGVTTGLDVSANFSTQNTFNYVGLKGRLFLGIGHRF